MNDKIKNKQINYVTQKYMIYRSGNSTVRYVNELFYLFK